MQVIIQVLASFSRYIVCLIDSVCMATRKSSRLNAKAETAAIATTKSVQKEKLVSMLTIPKESGETDTGIAEKTTEKARGSQSSKKRKISNEKEVSSDNAVAVKSSRASTKRKREDSKFLKEIPLDVLLEIFKLLEPIDLLHLSRVSSSLHDLLTSDDTTSLWKSVRLLYHLFRDNSLIIFH